MLQGKYPLLIALVLGLLAAIVATSAIKARERAVREGWAVKKILCATVDVTEGTELDDTMVGTCEIPEKFVTESFIVIPEGDDEGGMLPLGQKVLVPLRVRDPVLYSHFESQRDFTISESIPTKARAISIEVSEKGSVNQWIRPNDHVDIIGTFRDSESRDLIAVTLLQNIIVLATGRISGMTIVTSDEDKRYNQVVVMTLPEEAEILALAQESGALTLTLRNPRDLETEERTASKTDGKTLITGERTKALGALRKSAFQTVETIKGTSSNKERSIGPGAAVPPGDQ